MPGELTAWPEALDARDLRAFVALEHRARSAETPMEFAFILANETISLVPYAQAAVLEPDGKAICLSGVSLPDERSPFHLFLKRVAKKLPPLADIPIRIMPADLGADVAEDWDAWLSPCALWLAPRKLGWSMLIARDEPFSDDDIMWLSRLGGVFAHARAAVQVKRRLSWKWPPIAGRLVLAGLLALGLATPIRLTVLAPAEVVPIDPTIIRSPIDGIIDKIHVQPNERVAAGQRLVQLDTATLSSKLDVATKDLFAAQAEYRQAMQLAIADTRARAQLAVIQGRIETRNAEVSYLRALVEKAQIDTPVAGIAILDEPTDLVGRPVSIGERILSVADESNVEIEAWVGLADAIELPPDANVMLVLNAEPLRPLYGNVRYMAYEAQARPDGTTGYRLRARLKEASALPRIGMRGTMRLTGQQVSVAYWLARRPLAAVRQFLGL